MAEINIDLTKLPEDVREKLAELDLELSEGIEKKIDISFNLTLNSHIICEIISIKLFITFYLFIKIFCIPLINIRVLNYIFLRNIYDSY